MRILAIGLAVIAIAVCALVWPLAARELLSWRLWDASLIVVAMWATWWFGWTLPGYRKALFARPRPAAVQAQPSPPEPESQPKDRPVDSEGGAGHE
jgi:hypothetical protein